MAPPLQVRQAVEAAACLCGERDARLPPAGAGESEEARLAIRLHKRLEAYKAIASSFGSEDDGADIGSSGSNGQEETGQHALHALLLLHQAVQQERETRASQSSSSSHSAPILGSRDLHTIQTLLSILSNWGYGIRIAAFDASLSALQEKEEYTDKIVELPSEEARVDKRQADIHRYTSLCKESSSMLEISKRIMGIDGGKSEISNAFLHVCTPHVVSLSIRLGSCPLLSKDDTEGRARRELAQTLLHSILRLLSTSSCLQVLSAASQISTSSPVRINGVRKAAATTPAFVKAAIERLYSAQLLRVDGVLALLKISFGSGGNGDDEAAISDMNKNLARIGHLLTTPPPNMKMETFAGVMVPRLFEIVGELPDEVAAKGHEKFFLQSNSGQKTAACFALGRLFEIVPQTLLAFFESHFWVYLKPTKADEDDRSTHFSPGDVERTIETLTNLLEHSEPASAFLDALIATISIPLFTLSAYLNDRKRAATITEIKSRQGQELYVMTTSLLKTHLRSVSEEGAIDLLSPRNKSGLFATRGTSIGPIDESSIESLQPFWDHSGASIAISWRHTDSVSEVMNMLSSLQASDIKPISLTENAMEGMPSELLSQLSLSPSAILLSSLLKETSRKDIAIQLLSDLLEAYTLAKQEESSLLHPTSGSSSRSIVYIQHILELIKVFGEDILSGKIGRVLQFINFSLGGQARREGHEETHEKDDIVKDSRNAGHALGELLNISGSTNDDDSHDKGEPVEALDLELVETALNLLLSLMEGNRDLTMESHSIIKVIATQVDSIANTCIDADVRTLAKEARLVLTARRSTNVPSKSKSSMSEKEKSPLQQAYAKGNEKYQEALRLLQDPILPVRAHGLITLKELASFGSTDVSSKAILMDPALTNAILDIYLQAVEDDDCFLYLNAVKGLAEMANTGGRSMVRRIVGIYLFPASQQGNYTKQQVDKQLRMGEALLQVVQKLEEALSAYLEDIVDPLLTALRDRQRPTTLRASYLSILGTCVEASPMGIASSPYSSTIVDGMLDLLTVENSPRKRKEAAKHDGEEEEEEAEEEADAMQDPTHLDPKLPPLRRAAVLLLALFIRGSRHQLEAVQMKENEEVFESGTHSLKALRLPNGNIIGGSRSNQIDNTPPPPSLLFPEDKTARTKNVLTYLTQTDSDSLVRHQASEVLQELDDLTLARYTQ